MSRVPRMLLASMALSTLSVFLAPAWATAYYIDYSSGSNANNGTSKTTPWKSHPYMTNAAGCAGAPPSYTHAAGDVFIFKGGVTWPAACFTMTIAAGGSAGKVDYYGVDKTWYSGASWTQPIFDFGSALLVSNGDGIDFEVSYFTIDNFEMRNYRYPDGVSSAPCANGCATIRGDPNFSSTTTNVTISNNYIHNWANINSSPNGTDCDGNIAWCGGVNLRSPNSLGLNTDIIINNTFCCSTFGGSLNTVEAPTIQGNTFHDVCNALVFRAGNAIGNTIYNIENCTDPNLHENAIETASNDYQSIFADNVIYNVNAGVATLTCPNSVWYNNVIFSTGIFFPYKIDPNCGSDSSYTAYFYNNTGEVTSGSGSDGGVCFMIVNEGGTIGLTMENNFCITDKATSIVQGALSSTGACYNNLSAEFPCSNISSLTDSSNTMMNNATATSQGYTASETHPYSPTLATNSTVHSGTNLTGLNITGLDSDILGIGRPGGSAAWDTGAYEFGGPVPNPPTGLTAVVN